MTEEDPKVVERVVEVSIKDGASQLHIKLEHEEDFRIASMFMNRAFFRNAPPRSNVLEDIERAMMQGKPND